MPPQPLSSIREHPSRLDIGPHTLRQQPDLATLVMDVISTWSSADLTVVELISNMLEADFEIVAIMLGALRSAEGKRAAIDATAKVRLAADPELLSLFEAVMKVTKASRSRRNDFAHHVWASCPDIPKSLCLIDPRYMGRFFSELSRYRRGVPKRTPVGLRLQSPDFDYSNVLVFRKKDFEEESKNARRAARLMTDLRLALDANHPASAERRALLENDPDIQRLLRQQSTQIPPTTLGR